MTGRFRVKLISTTNPINDPTDLENIYLKAGDGRMVPMSTIATLDGKGRIARPSTGKASCARFQSPPGSPKAWRSGRP